MRRVEEKTLEETVSHNTALHLEMRVGVQQQLLLVALEEEKCCSRREFPSCSL
jgi:hypothetical protein